MGTGGSAALFGVLLAAAQLGIPVFDSPDTVLVEARRQWMPRPQIQLLYGSLHPTLHTQGLLKVPNSASFPAGPPIVDLSRFGRIAYGADTGAYGGLSIGVLGSWLGLWEEHNAWTMMGAGAALGAILGGATGSETSRIRIRATASPPAP